MSLITPDIGLLFWMLVSFSIGLIILRKYAWKPILDSLTNRENSIEEALRTADKVKEEMEKMQADNQQLLKEARNEREKLLKEANETKNSIIKEARDKASDEANRIMAEAKQEITNEKNKALKEVKGQVAEISIEIAEKLLKKKLNSDREHHNYASDLIKDINFN
ncbi:MAG: F0F1 ATP synthase subunit B [Bacteroidia bacterium]|nr:F0F1 ATP synthase subunit B [Bacteroidia bacterium]